MNTLPLAIAGYIDAANAQAPERLAACFHPELQPHHPVTAMFVDMVREARALSAPSCNSATPPAR